MLSDVISDHKKDYDALAKRNDELQSLAALDDEGIANLSIYLPPRKPDSKDGPQRAKLVLMGLFAGLAARLRSRRRPSA